MQALSLSTSPCELNVSFRLEGFFPVRKRVVICMFYDICAISYPPPPRIDAVCTARSATQSTSYAKYVVDWVDKLDLLELLP